MNKIINYMLGLIMVAAFVIYDDPEVKTRFLILAAFNFTWARMHE